MSERTRKALTAFFICASIVLSFVLAMLIVAKTGSIFAVMLAIGLVTGIPITACLLVFPKQRR